MHTTLALLVAALGTQVAAYPTVAEAIIQASAEQQAERRDTPQLPGLNGGRFNPKLQHVSTTGAHKFQMPNLAAGDQRGPCPGLNAMANHGYIPRSGVGKTLDFISGTYQVFGMGADLSGFLTVLGSTIDGDGTSWSIGGPSKLSNTLGGLLGEPQGLSGSHNKYEADASPCRGDLYLNGNDFTLQMPQFMELYNMGKANGDNIDLALMERFRSKRFDQSVQKNPYFFNGPFTGVLVQPAAYSFIYRFMSNKSAEHPSGKLNTAVMSSFMGVHKQKDGSLKHIPGSERIPDNWYKRALGDEYTIPFLNTDTTLAIATYPKFASIGGNLGKVNTFTGVKPEDISGGAYHADTLTEGNNLVCFASQFATQTQPDLLKCQGVLSDIAGASGKLAQQFDKSFGSLGCPKLTNPQTKQFNKFPGYKNLDCRTGTYKK